MKRTSGITLVELLIALAILSTVIALSSSGIIGTLRAQSINEANTSSQAKMRRISEVLTQEVRGAVLGGIAAEPYASGENSVSFLLLDGGAGYQVLPFISSFNQKNFKSQNRVRVATGDRPEELINSQALLVNTNGEAVVFDVSTVSGEVSGEAKAKDGAYVVRHNCTDTIPYTNSMLLFKVKTTGIEYDKNSGTLLQTEANEPEPNELAFDLSEFSVKYVYQDDDGKTYSLKNPLLNGDDLPLTSGSYEVKQDDETTEDEDESETKQVTLVRLQLVMGAEVPAAGGRTVERSFASSIELANLNQTQQVKGASRIRAVKVCKS